MTIKKLCFKYIDCKKCPFNAVCELLDRETPDEIDNRNDDQAITRAIIETARILLEQE